MKHDYFSLLVLLLLPSLVTAQVTDVVNNNINFEFTIEYNHYFNASSEVGNSEPVIQTDIWTSNYGWLGEQCHNWSCEPPCYNGGGDNIYWAGQCNFDATMQVWMLSYESDNSDECTWTSGDDDDWQGTGVLREGQTIQRIVYPSSDFRPCQIINALGNGGTGWLFPNNPHFNQILQLKWRYMAGDSPQDPLSFGTIGSNQAKSDINSNRSMSSVGEYVPVGYTHVNNSEYSSPDVWYEFTITEDMPVTIRTNHGETDFDTYLRLWTQAGAFVAEDDQSGGSNTSLINTTLCAGTYSLCVEGWQSSTGNFKVSVETGSPVSGVNANVSTSGVSCSGEGDGYAEWNPTGGVPPYDWTWQGVNIPGNYFSGLAEGNFSVVVTDACGTTDAETVVIDVDDNTDPIAQCNSSVDLNVWQGNTTTLFLNDVDNGSSDNCGVASRSLSQVQFQVSDAGTNTVTLTVTDWSGNTDECSITVYVNNTTGVEEAELLNNMNVYPNPNNGQFQIDLSNAKLENDATLSILDKVGRMVHTSAATASIINLDLTNLPGGVYLVQVENNGVTATKRMVVVK